tara:strand:+ start:96 stop:491 length:396 start_codon:yes stop_codon:yes gene_type:complete
MTYVYQNNVRFFDYFTFTFTVDSHASFDMLIINHSNMDKKGYDTMETVYRKRLEPCRIVTLDSLVKTNDGQDKKRDVDSGILVNYNGIFSENNDNWNPIQKQILPISVNANSWEGLRQRLQYSKSNQLGVF